MTQLYEMFVVRHGLMLVGEAMRCVRRFSVVRCHNRSSAEQATWCRGRDSQPSAQQGAAAPPPPAPDSGKTSALQVLAAALSELADAGVPGPLFSRVQARTINPKAVTMGQLYGEADRATQEWRDGVLAVAFRWAAANEAPLGARLSSPRAPSATTWVPALPLNGVLGAGKHFQTVAQRVPRAQTESPRGPPCFVSLFPPTPSPAATGTNPQGSGVRPLPRPQMACA